MVNLLKKNPSLLFLLNEFELDVKQSRAHDHEEDLGASKGRGQSAQFPLSYFILINFGTTRR